MSEYRIISSDSHIIEPADLWKKRIDAKFRDRAPSLVREGEDDQWYCDGQTFGNVGINQQAGVRFEDPTQLRREGSMDTVPLGGLDPDAHVKDMDVDGVVGGVLYPSQCLTVYRIPAGDLLSAVFRAYNDYLAEFCQAHPNRLKGIAMLNVDFVDDAVGEIERAAKIGLAGAMISIRPILRYDHLAYERLWAAAQDLDMPLSLHVGTTRWRPGVDFSNETFQNPFFFPNREYDVRECINSMVFGGVFERYPGLRVGAVEFEISWAPYFITTMDSFYKERVGGVSLKRFKNDMMPSDFFRRNVFIGFQEDDLGIELRHRIGVENLLWGSDYPHAESTFPKSREILERILQGVPEEEKAKIAGDNTAKLYHFS
jgi:predicted TIM-barrel fold metal-dependent hydrolase